jgi:hypothetical protein
MLCAIFFEQSALISASQSMILASVPCTLNQFMRLREVIEERASRKFFEEKAQADRPVVLRANDFSR